MRGVDKERRWVAVSARDAESARNGRLRRTAGTTGHTRFTGNGLVEQGSRGKDLGLAGVGGGPDEFGGGVYVALLEMRKRVKGFREGIAVGSEDDVRGAAARYQAEFGRKKKRRAKPMKGTKGTS
ncbi:MAG: hypothetical protein RL346_1354 [Verrucomicrobiota bacterium]|jgi:hypothetical protein